MHCSSEEIAVETLRKCGQGFESDLRATEDGDYLRRLFISFSDADPISKMTGVEVMSSIFERKPLRV